MPTHPERLVSASLHADAVRRIVYRFGLFYFPLPVEAYLGR
jgi:hypothetical protein